MVDDYQYGDRMATRYWRGYGQTYRYRQDPVPGVRKWRGGSCFRSPRTTQELTNGYIADDEDHSLLTAAQVHKITRVRDLPSAWDDILRGDYRKHTSWKSHRSTQYHGVVIEGDPSCSRNSVD